MISAVARLSAGAHVPVSLTGESSWATPVPLCIACARMRRHLSEKVFSDFR